MRDVYANCIGFAKARYGTVVRANRADADPERQTAANSINPARILFSTAGLGIGPPFLARCTVRIVSPPSLTLR